MIVVDASLAAKWIFWEAQSKLALEFWSANAGELAAPDLVALEVATAIVRRANADKALSDAMADALDLWARFLSGVQLQLWRMTPDRVVRSSRLAMMLGHPVKDCVYLDLAMELDCPLYTCDAKFALKARDTGYDSVKLLGE
jgi:predicted nucleic acid-binding protein